MKNSKTISNYKTTFLNIQTYLGMFVCFCILFAYVKHDPSVPFNKSDVFNRSLLTKSTIKQLRLEHTPMLRRLRRDLFTSTPSSQPSTTNNISEATQPSTFTTTKFHAKKPEIADGNQLQQDHKTKPPESRSSSPVPTTLSTNSPALTTKYMAPIDILHTCLDRVNQSCLLNIQNCQYKKLTLNVTQFNRFYLNNLNMSLVNASVVPSASKIKCNNISYTYSRYLHKLNQTRQDSDSLMSILSQTNANNSCYGLMKSEYTFLNGLNNSFVLNDDHSDGKNRHLSRVTNNDQSETRLVNCFNMNHLDREIYKTFMKQEKDQTVREKCFVFAESWLDKSTNDYLVYINHCDLDARCEVIHSDVEYCFKLFNDSLKLQTTTSATTITPTITFTTTTR